MRLSTCLLIVALGAVLLPATADAQRRIPDPQIPPPTITEYKPRSTLVVPEHPVPPAQFPVVETYEDLLSAICVPENGSPGR